MKSKIVRGIINGGVLAAVAALGITVYQLGTKPIAENPQEENSVQVEETGLEEELSDGENAEDAAAAGDGWQDAAQDEISDGETGDEAGLSGASEAGADGVTGSIRETAGSGTAENAAADADNGSGTDDRSVSAAAGADRSRTDGTGNTADNAGNTSAEGAVNNGAGASTDTAETSAVGIAAQALDFTEDSIMEWPVRGTVLVDYNMDETVYYPTLDQYRVSSAIALQAVEDAPVYAAADGQVLSVVQDACTGTTVTMELGQTAIIANGPWMISDFYDTSMVEDGFADKVGTAMYPGDVMYNSGKIGFNVASKDEKTLDATLTFVKFLTNEESQLKMLEITGDIPAMEGLTSDNVKPLVNEVIANGDKAAHRINDFQSLWYANVVDEISIQYPLLAQGEITPEEFAQALTDAAQKN